MKQLSALALLLSLSLAAGCQRDEANDYISVNGKVFIFNIRLAKAYYTLNLNRLNSVPDGSIVLVEFENPAGGPPLVSEQKVFPKMTRIDLQSPDLECVVADKPYKITVTLKSPEGKDMQVLETMLTSTLDQTVMPQTALVEGAAYDKNPAAYDQNGKIKFRKSCSELKKS